MSVDLFKLSRNFGWFKSTIFFVSVVTSSAAYQFVSANYFPEINLFQFSPIRKSYDFYGGSGGGLYTHIGSALQAKSKEDRWSGYEIRNQNTAGGSSNAISVLMTPKSFGLVQEETISENDFIREQLHYVSPLYLERMHILFRKTPSVQKITLDKTLSHNVRAFFNKARINTGPVGSGTRVLASYVINELDIGRDVITQNDADSVCKSENCEDGDGLRSERIFNYDSSVAIPRMTVEPHTIDVVFLVTGAPNKRVAETLRIVDEAGRSKFGLVSVSPAFVAELNKKYSLNLRMSDFKSKPNSGADSSAIYKGMDSISTIGTYAFLISSSDVSAHEHNQVIRLLTDEDTKDAIRSMAGIDGFSHNPLSEIAYGDKFKSDYFARIWSFVRALLAFVVSVGVLTALIFRAFTKLLSSYTYSKFASILQEFHEKLSESKVFADHTKPVEYLKSVIDDIGSSEVEVYRQNHRGMISAEHHAAAVEGLERMKSDARMMLHRVIANADTPPEKELLKDLFIRGYVSREVYEQ